MKNNFLTLRGLFVCTIFTLISATQGAQASHNEVVRDSKGNLVRTSGGDCVRTQWTSSVDECKGEVHKTVRQDAIDEIMKMDERIIYFDFDKSDIKDSEKDKLDTLAEVLKEHKIKKVKVVGYTDKIGKKDYNHALSHRRANAVKKYLDSKVKLQSSKVHLKGLGKEHQIKECEGIHERHELIDCLAPNRRVEIEVDYMDNK